jgi:hypothetical protein
MTGPTGVRGEEAVFVLLYGAAAGEAFGGRLVAAGDPGDAQGRRYRNESDEKGGAQSPLVKGSRRL